MKNNYSFEQLTRKTSLLPTEKDRVFADMLKVVRNGSLLLTTDSLAELESILDCDIYYIIHNLVSYKGKKAILKGAAVKTFRSDLLKFLEISASQGDMRNLLISPIFNETPKQVLYLTEDLYYLYNF